MLTSYPETVLVCLKCDPDGGFDDTTLSHKREHTLLLVRVKTSAKIQSMYAK